MGKLAFFNNNKNIKEKRQENRKIKRNLRATEPKD